STHAILHALPGPGSVLLPGAGSPDVPPRDLSLHVRTTLRAGSTLSQFDPDDQLETSPRLSCAGWSAIPHLCELRAVIASEPRPRGIGRPGQTTPVGARAREGTVRRGPAS